MAGAFQRLEKADHLESQAFDAGVTGVAPGAVLASQLRVQGVFIALNRYRATAQSELATAYRLLALHRASKDAGREAAGDDDAGTGANAPTLLAVATAAE